ncbi:NB-ARC domain-containing protein [Streptomyces sp. R35]|uniref:NB-ARC domain-containing protein n=1 Tax=Streptomyces sp. R35 TaxID=3238630 RepID=A0AB39RVS9_9ACTN
MSINQLTVVQQRVPREPVPWPHQVGVIPSRAQSFQHRVEVSHLRTVVESSGTTVLGQVLTGMGGVGKTQLAADYARTAWQDGSLDVLVWVTASARSPIVTGYAQAGAELCQADPDDPEQAAQAFLAWLTPKARAKPCRWLIVLDDIADPDDLRGLWPPTSPHGRTLVTTRRRDAALTGDTRRLIEVGLFRESEALAYLTTSLAAHGRKEPPGQLAILANELGNLPLALAQASAYLIDSGEDLSIYRALLADRTTTLADTAPDHLPDEQTLPLAAAWSLSIDRADTLRPTGLARPMLEIAALLDPNGIPQHVLTSPPVLTCLTAHRTPTGPQIAKETSPISPRDAMRALRALHRLNLIDHTSATPNQAVRVHQLIQRATRDTLTVHQRNQLARTAADALVTAWPAVERDTTLAQILRANATALARCAEDSLYLPDVHSLLYRVGLSLGEIGQTIEARDHYAHLADAAEARLGAEHPQVLIARRGQALWRAEAGDAAGAAATFAQLLGTMTKVLGPYHRDTLATRSYLANYRGMSGDATSAATAYAELLPDLVRVMGADHPDTLTARSRLARWRGGAGDAPGAASAMAELLPDLVRVMGADHPQTLSSRAILAWWTGVSGDAVGAAALFAELVEDRMRILGPDHPHTLSDQGNLAHWRGETGDAVGAATMLTELLPNLIRVVGPDHPDTLGIRGRLAHYQGMSGDVSTAVSGCAEVLEDQLRVLGPDHLDTLATRDNLARWRSRAGDDGPPSG